MSANLLPLRLHCPGRRYHPPSPSPQLWLWV